MKKPISKHTPEKPEYPMRINRYLALKNYATRRGADELIEKAKVKINGKIAKLGDKVSEKDDVEVLEKINQASFSYLAYYKARGVVTSTPQAGEKSIEDVLRYRTRVFPIGRLDKESEGLIILTNDGRITKRLLDPEFNHEKEYSVVVNKTIKENFEVKMSRGVPLEDFTTKPCKVVLMEEQDNAFKIVLTEGKKHQIRRMCTYFGYEVRTLKRIRILNIKIGNLRPGELREIEGSELKKFMSELGM